MWRTYSARVKPPPTEGAQVFVFGTPTVWEERGEFRLTVTEFLVTDQVGQAQLDLERIRKALEKDGLFDPARKRPLPALPERIAVVTSLDGAALRDIITVTRKRWAAVELLVIGTRVQGADAPAELVRALGLVNRLTGIDCCIVARGGGSREDLAAFDIEAVCRAIAAVKVPIISAVGHETDISLTDLVADVRAATPSAAIEIVVPDRGRPRPAGGRPRPRASATRWAGAPGSPGSGSPGPPTGSRRRWPGAWTRPAGRSSGSPPSSMPCRPLKVLERGYGVAQDGAGQVLRRRAEFTPGLPFTLRVTDGSVFAREDRPDDAAEEGSPSRGGSARLTRRGPDAPRGDRAAARAEDGDLDQSLALFEEGVARLRGARERLGAAEARVQKVLEDADGTLRMTISIVGPDVALLLAEARDRTDALLGAWAERVLTLVPGRIGQAIAYALQRPGKRVRAALVLSAYRAVGGVSPAIAGVAAAVETVHTYSLVHDDLPCMDDDDLRRGRATTHRAFDVPTATRVGYLLVPIAAMVLAQASRDLVLSAETLGRMAVELFEAGGHRGNGRRPVARSRGGGQGARS